MNSFRTTTLILFGLIMLGAIVRTLIPSEYQLTASETIEIDSQQTKFHYMQLHRIVAGNKLSQFEIVDLRTADEFAKDHIKGALNIPYRDLAGSNFFSNGSDKPVLIYADSETKAASAAFILLQKGVNARYIPGNFETIDAFVLKNFDLEHAFYNEEKMKYNYKSYFSGNATEPETKSIAKPVGPRNVPQAASGGC